MEDDQDENLEDILTLIKEIKKNNEELKKKKLDNEIINKIEGNKKDKKKNYLKLKYTELYIVDKKPIEELMEDLQYNKLEKLIPEDEEDDEDDLKNKIEEIHKDTDFSKLKEKIIKDINVYSTEEEIDEIIENQKEVILINEDILKNLNVPYKKYKEKGVFAVFQNHMNIIYFPKQHFSVMIKDSLINIQNASNQSEKQKNIINDSSINNINVNNMNMNMNVNNDPNLMSNMANIHSNNINTKQINISKNNINGNINSINLPINNQMNNLINNNININNTINQNNNPSKKENSFQNNSQINVNNKNIINSETINLINNAQNIQLLLNKKISIVSNHIMFLNNLNNLPSLNIFNLKDISQIKNINNNNKLNILMIKSDSFELIKQDLLYDECLLFFQLDMNNSQQKYNELQQKMNVNINEINNTIKIIKSYNDFNPNNNEQYMFVNEEFCYNIGVEKQNYINSKIFLFKANNELFIFFADKETVMKVYLMNQYYKISNCFGDMIDTPQEIIDTLITLYKQSKIFDEYLTEYELKDNNFRNYYLVNKKWIEQFKQFYNFEDIYIKYEEESFIEEEDNNNMNNNNINNNIDENINIIGMGKGKRKRKKKNKNRNKNKNKANNINRNNQNQNKDPVIKSQHKNFEIPNILLDEKNILCNVKQFKESNYPTDFELIENQTLKNLCKCLKLEVSPNIFEQSSIEALPGSNIIILKRKDNSLVVFTIKGILNILEYIIMFENRKALNNEINYIKQKGIEQYLIEKYLKFNDDSLQYIPDSNGNSSIVAKIYICNKKQIDYSINNNNIYFQNPNNLNNIINNYQYANVVNYQILPTRAGLDNIGATCYMNATLQSLCNIPVLQQFFLYNNDLYQNPNAILSKAFGDVMRNLYNRTKNKISFSPHHFKDVISEMNPLFKGIAANDSKDLILFLLEKMHEELNVPQNYIPEPNLSEDLLIFRQTYYSVNCSILQKTFIHEMESKIKCCNCGFETYNYSAHNFLIFPLEKVRQYKINKYPQGFIYVNLDDCLEQQQSIEYLQGDSMIYCNGCKQICVAENINTMNTCPDILIIILNRGKGNEFQVDFDFPMKMDLFNYIIMKNKNTQYELISIIVHTGGNDMSGHFYSYCKSNIDKKWYRYNDSLVDMLDDNYLYTIKNVGLPYVLFYQNTSCNNIGINTNNINNIQNGQITLYFKLIDINKELFLDVNNNDVFSFVVQKLAQKYCNTNYNFFNCYYYSLMMMNQTQIIDFNKTVFQNNLSDSSFIIIKANNN